MRKNDHNFVVAFVEELGKAQELNDDVIARAAARAYSPGRGIERNKEATRRYLLMKAWQKLETTNVQDAIAEYYETATEFTRADAAAWLVKHIKGDITKEQVAKNGQVVSVKVAPSLVALLAYNKLTLPQPEKRVRVDNRTLVARFDVKSGEQPPIDALPIGGSK